MGLLSTAGPFQHLGCATDWLRESAAAIRNLPSLGKALDGLRPILLSTRLRPKADIQSGRCTATIRELAAVTPMAGLSRSYYVISDWTEHSPVPPMPPSRGQSSRAGISLCVEQEASALRSKNAIILRIILIGLAV